MIGFQQQRQQQQVLNKFHLYSGRVPETSDSAVEITSGVNERNVLKRFKKDAQIKACLFSREGNQNINCQLFTKIKLDDKACTRVEILKVRTNSLKKQQSISTIRRLSGILSSIMEAKIWFTEYKLELCTYTHTRFTVHD